MRRERVALAIRDLLAVQPDQNKRQLLARLGKRAARLTTTDVNSVLYSHRDLFISDGGTPPRWRLTGSSRSPEERPAAEATTFSRPRGYVGMDPRAWQREALAAWQARGRRGVIEAVTGTGKTAVGVLAAAAAVARDEKVLILVPGQELLRQWYEILRKDLPLARVGCFGARQSARFDDHDVLVATVQSASRWQLLTPGRHGLLIADEVHRYGADTFALALKPQFHARLGLTATFEREDDGVARHLEPYFGGVVFRCGYERGLADEILARFRVAFLGVEFSPEEREQHDEYDDQARSLRRRLIDEHACPAEPFGEFMAAVQQLSTGGLEDARPTKDARRYLNAFSKRRQLLAGCRRKHDALGALVPLLHAADRGLVFSETKDSASSAAQLLRRQGLAAMDFTSALKQREREERLADFRRGAVHVLTAPRVLDEGVDVPEADVGVVLAASRSRRQMIQRMGRVIRPKSDHRPATFIVMYVRGTAEDPANGAHEAFLDQLTDVAEETVFFDQRDSGAQLLAWHMSRRSPHVG
ncbi:DEAD/DEAH box helicase family protein [Geodermatophilus sp. SYSU D01119]